MIPMTLVEPNAKLICKIMKLRFTYGNSSYQKSIRSTIMNAIFFSPNISSIIELKTQANCLLQTSKAISLLLVFGSPYNGHLQSLWCVSQWCSSFSSPASPQLCTYLFSMPHGIAAVSIFNLVSLILPLTSSFKLLCILSQTIACYLSHHFDTFIHVSWPYPVTFSKGFSYFTPTSLTYFYF